MRDDEVRGVRLQQTKNEDPIALEVITSEVQMRVVAVEQRIVLDRLRGGVLVLGDQGLSQMSNQEEFQARGDVFDPDGSNERVRPGEERDEIQDDNHRVPEEEKGEQLLEEKIVRQNAFHRVPMRIVQMIRFADSTKDAELR